MFWSDFRGKQRPPRRRAPLSVGTYEYVPGIFVYYHGIYIYIYIWRRRWPFSPTRYILFLDSVPSESLQSIVLFALLRLGNDAGIEIKGLFDPRVAWTLVSRSHYDVILYYYTSRFCVHPFIMPANRTWVKKRLTINNNNNHNNNNNNNNNNNISAWYSSG